MRKINEISGARLWCNLPISFNQSGAQRIFYVIASISCAVFLLWLTQEINPDWTSYEILYESSNDGVLRNGVYSDALFNGLCWLGNRLGLSYEGFRYALATIEIYTILMIGKPMTEGKAPKEDDAYTDKEREEKQWNYITNRCASSMIFGLVFWISCCVHLRAGLAILIVLMMIKSIKDYLERNKDLSTERYYPIKLIMLALMAFGLHKGVGIISMLLLVFAWINRDSGYSGGKSWVAHMIYMSAPWILLPIILKLNSHYRPAELSGLINPAYDLGFIFGVVLITVYRKKIWNAERRTIGTDLGLYLIYFEGVYYIIKNCTGLLLLYPDSRIGHAIINHYNYILFSGELATRYYLAIGACLIWIAKDSGKYRMLVYIYIGIFPYLLYMGSLIRSLQRL